MFKAIIILIEMYFLHIFADYHLQGILANMKQRDWWKKKFVNVSEFNQSKYTNDYTAALMSHSFEWTFIMMIPVMHYVNYNDYIYWHVILYMILFILNLGMHYVVDDMKANGKRINLIQDQQLHMVQINLTWLIWYIFTGWI